MATRNIVPRADGEGKLGTAAKKWGEVHAGSVTATGAVSAGSVTATGAVSAGSVTATGAVSAAGITTRQNYTAYAVDDVAFSASLPGKLMLVCTAEGTTAATEPDFSGATVGGTVTDGTVVWTYTPFGTLTREITPAFNHRDEITTSGTYTAPVTGWYRITIKGGGGGGAGGNSYSGVASSGAGGGEGGTTIAYEKMTAGQTASVVIGAGGAGGPANYTSIASDGGNSSITIGDNTYTAGGGKGAYQMTGGAGGTGTNPGAPGGAGLIKAIEGGSYGSSGGGAGGGAGDVSAKNGGGGGGNGYNSNTGHVGSTGGSGFAWFEYFDPTLM